MAEQLQIDGAMDFLGGQDASKIPDRIADNCYYAGINVSTDKGSIKPRWGFDKRTLSFKFEEYEMQNLLKRTYEDIFYSGKFQAAAPYHLGGSLYSIVVVSGIIYSINMETYTAEVIHIVDGSTINEMASRISWASAGKYLIFFDYPNFPVIIENGLARRADPANMEIPVSTFGVYNQNRLFVSNAGNDFTASDPYGGLAPGQNGPITFQEVMLPASSYLGQIFQLPTMDSNDPITSMGFLQMTDTSTGIGPLLVATKNAIYAYSAQLPRDQWEAGQFGTSLVFNAGVAGPRAMCNVNSDMFFVSSDGQVRTVSMSRDEQRKWTKEPISREVGNWLKLFDKSLVEFATLAYFKNKIFVTANPYRSKARTRERLPVIDYAHGGMVVLETDNIATLGSTSPPVWAGLWTGVHPMEMITIDERFFLFSKDAEFRNTLYEVNPATTYDTDGDNIRYVRSRIYTKEHDFKDPFSNKVATSFEVNFDNLQGDFSMEVKYKPSHSPYFYDWRTFKHTAPWRVDFPTPAQLLGLEPQHVRDINLGDPESDTCSAVTAEYNKVFRKVQLQFTVTGKYWEIHEYRVVATFIPRNNLITTCIETCPVKLPVAPNDDWYVSEFKPCQQLMT